MKKTKAVVSLILSLALIFSTVEMLKISAATSNTQRSEKYLMNGSFEQVDNSGFSNGYKIFSDTDITYWKTTASDNKLEFFDNNTKYHFSTSPAAYRKVADKDEIAAELNANEESTIYQKIHTFAGSTYTWGLYHRGREITDRMVLIIGPEQAVDPKKKDNNKNNPDQFVRITNWLKTQYGVDYPEIGCSHKYTVYSRPFAENGNFQGNISDDNKNISLVATEDINQEWSVWVISSPKCNTSDGNVNGWSAYGTHKSDSIEDILKGASSSLGYDCTYTVPNKQENTIFAFCSYSSGRLVDGIREDAPSYGNLLDGIEFDLYQPVSSSITPGGIAGAETIKVTSDILSDNSMHSIILDGKDCTLYTKKHEDSLQGCSFTGAYVTVNNANGTSVTTFRSIYDGNFEELSEEEQKKKEKEFFIHKPGTEVDGKTWDYYTKISVNSPVSVHLIYTKAPFVLYDSNGGKEYYFSPDNNSGGNLVGFAGDFQAEQDSDYYTNSQVNKDGNTIQTGFYKSHAALPNDNWGKDENGESPHKFCGWSVLDNNQNQIILNSEHTVKYNPETGNGGIVSITDSDGGSVDNLQLDASHGITLTALWKFANKAQAQTKNDADEYVNSAVGGYVEETLIADELRGELVENHYVEVNGVQRIVSVDALGDVGDKIMFKATPDSANNYAFTGWYCKNKETGNYELKSTSTSIAVTIEEGIFNTYYARFEKATYPVVFKYTSSGSGDDDAYDYYQKSADNEHGQYYQNVVHNQTAVKPSGDSVTVKTWYTSPTERGTEYIFDFSTPITEQTVLYAGPSFTYNYFNYFKLKEPWYINTYGTLKFDGNYIDLKNNDDVTDYNVYMLKDTSGNTTAPSPSAIKGNSATIKVGKSVNSDNLIFNTLTSTGQTFNRAGATYSKFYLFNMETPVWVVFDFTYKGIKYTSTVKNRSLYNCITTYMDDNNKLYTNYPPKEQAVLRNAQEELLNSIKNMYDEVSKFEITEPSDYAQASSVSGLTYDSTTENPYTFNSSTAIRNIEPWGLKYSFTVTDNTVTDNTETENTETENTDTENTDTSNIVTTFSDYGAVVLTDKDGTLNAEEISIPYMLNNENSVMYSKSNSNVYSLNGAVEIYYVNNMLASDFDKNTYAVFFVKDSDGKYYYSNIVNNSYTTLASQDTSEYKDISKSIITYSEKLKAYCKLIDDPNSGNQ